MSLGFSCELTKNDLSIELKRKLNDKSLRNLREKLFLDAKRKKLCDSKDLLVTRQNRASGPTLKEKHARDIAQLVYSLKHHQIVPRILLKNGKRVFHEFVDAREKVVIPPATEGTPTSMETSVNSHVDLSGQTWLADPPIDADFSSDGDNNYYNKE